MYRLAPLAFLVGLACLPSLALAGDARDPYRLVVVTRPRPYWGYGYSSYGDAMRGLADYARAEGDYLIKREKARFMREETRQKRLETRKVELEHIKWERDFIWNLHREEESKAIAYAAKRAKETPTLTEILSGGMLNILHRELSLKSRPPDSPSQPILEGTLENINFTATGGNTGLLRQKEISWPPLIQDDRLAATRKAIEDRLELARRDAEKGKVSGKNIEELLALGKTLEEESFEIFKASKSFGLRHQIQAMRFTRELNEQLKLLENPKEAAFLLNLKPNAKTVAELVQFMRDHALTFGPASAGSERHYVALHDKMAEEARNQDRRPGAEK